jgi:hypothetical protein
MTRTQDLADLFSALATHLRAYPHLPTVDVAERGQAATGLQISTFPHLGETDGVAALLLWAKTLDRPEITIRWHSETHLVTTVTVTSRLGGQTVEVWDVDNGDLHRWLTSGSRDRIVITLAQLAGYVAAGTVEHADEHAPGTFTAEQLAEVEHWSKTPLPDENTPAVTS